MMNDCFLYSNLSASLIMTLQIVEERHWKIYYYFNVTMYHKHVHKLCDAEYLSYETSV
jgi:hypothetical protein